MRWETLPARPQDRDTASIRTESMFVIHSSRPAHVSGPPGCRHPDDLEISFLERGTSFAEVGGRDVVLRPGHYSVIAAGVEHSSATREEATSGLYLQLASRFFERASAELGLPPWGARPAEARVIPPDMRGVISALRTEVLSGRAAAPMVESLGCYLAGYLLRAHHGADAASGALRDGGVAKRLERSIDLMRACPEQRLSLDDLAAASALSKFRFAHLFKSRYGTSPFRYLTRLRIDLAAQRLAKEDVTLTRVAYELGFSSSSQFSRAFRRERGMTPSSWRKRHGAVR